MLKKNPFLGLKKIKDLETLKSRKGHETQKKNPKQFVGSLLQTISSLAAVRTEDEKYTLKINTLDSFVPRHDLMCAFTCDSAFSFSARSYQKITLSKTKT